MKRTWVLTLILCALIASVAIAETHMGTGRGFNGDINAEVTISDGKIIDVKLTGEGETPEIGGAALEKLEKAFIEAGTPEIEAISGASFTSAGAVAAVQAAVNEANGVTGGRLSFIPGTYTATVAGHNSDFEIKVTFSQDKIEGIEIGANVENHSVGDRAMQDLTDIILEKQTLNIDAVAGATVTSNGFLKAVSDAVVSAGGDPTLMQEKVTPKNSATPEETTVDVVVVGAGGAGLAAAVEAKQNGLNVILVEQLGIVGGASGRAGYLFAVGTKVHEAQGIQFDVDDMVEFAHISDERTIDYLKSCRDDVNWLYDMGIEFGDINLYYQAYGPNGARLGGYLVEGLRRVMDNLGLDYRLNTRADHLLTDETGKVTGVAVEAPNGEMYNINAKAVVLSTGGFFGNKEMTEEYFPGFGKNPFDCGIGADGSGMKMAEAVGAELITMDYANFHAIAGFYRGASRSLTLIAGNGGIAVNQDAKRFYNEAGDYTEFTHAAMQQDRVVAIFDKKLADLDVIQGDVGCAATWGMYTVCDTLDEVAEAMKLDADALKETIEGYASGVEKGEDEFGKAPAYMRSDLKEGPYYAVETIIENHTTYGGIKTNTNTEALTPDDQVIPGLYAAGECTSKKTYMLGNLGPCVNEGRTAIRTFIETQKQ